MRTKLVATNLIWAVALTTSVLWLHHTRPVLMDWHTVPGPHEQLPLKTLDEIRAEGVGWVFERMRFRMPYADRLS